MSVALLLLTLAAPEVAPPGLAPGASLAEVKRAAQRLEDVRWLRADAPQALRHGLLDTRLLEGLNRFGLAPKDDAGGLDPRAFTSLLTASARGARYAAALADEGRGEVLWALLVRLPVPPDGDPWSRGRLGRLEAALAALARTTALEPVERDTHGNSFSWRGSRAGVEVRVHYLPEEDELRVLWVHPRAARASATPGRGAEVDGVGQRVVVERGVEGEVCRLRLTDLGDGLL